MADQDRYSREDMAAMFRRTVRTIDNWRRLGLIPPANRIVREPYWTGEQVEETRRNLSQFAEVRRNAMTETAK